jgi:adenylyl- and sulfurtransferase ThiI
MYVQKEHVAEEIGEDMTKIFPKLMKDIINPPKILVRFSQINIKKTSFRYFVVKLLKNKSIGKILKAGREKNDMQLRGTMRMTVYSSPDTTEARR